MKNYRAWTVMKWISKDLSVVETFIFFQNLDTPAFEQSSCIHNHHVLTTGWFSPHFYVSRYFSRNYTSWVEGKKQLYRCFQIFVAYLFLEPNSKSSVEFKLDFPSIHPVVFFFISKNWCWTQCRTWNRGWVYLRITEFLYFDLTLILGTSFKISLTHQ